jgi:2-polyprenyl-3-methyl-5-hydroxy-6-metoxy-1,4-benzoquinol methylase
MNPINEEQKRYKSFVFTDPVGFAHNMRPSSITTLFEMIDYERIKKAKVLEVGCGQGFLVNHFLNAKAKHVIGTEIEQQILDTIPIQAYNVYPRRSYEFKMESIENTDENINVDIITIFIGNLEIVKKAIRMFENNKHIKTLAFMVPTRGFKPTLNSLDELIQTHNWLKEEFSVSLSGSGERRKTIVLKKTIEMIDLTGGQKTKKLKTKKLKTKKLKTKKL